jgi:hypothetical protein
LLMQEIVDRPSSPTAIRIIRWFGLPELADPRHDTQCTKCKDSNKKFASDQSVHDACFLSANFGENASIRTGSR